MTRRLWAFVALAAVLAALFVRLGFWQLDRLAQRRRANREVAARLATPPVAFADVAAGGSGVYRRAVVIGAPDHANEFAVTGRSNQGSPGVHVFTPVRVPGQDTAVLVNRGWVYSPDARTIDLARWRETRTAFSGYTLEVPSGPGAAAITGRGMRPLRADGIRRLVPYPVAAVYLVAQDSAGQGAPVRLPPPALDEGPHLSYAIQWFSFATIALVGAAVVVRRARGTRGTRGTRVAGGAG